MGDPAAGASALQWALAAMSETAERLARVRVWDRARALTMICDAVWWVTIADATLVRHHPGAYDSVLASQTPAQRARIDGTLAGLRFVRNQLGHDVDLAEFTGPAAPGSRAGDVRITGWTWKPAREPALASLPPPAQAWEMTRYRAYQAHLVGHSTGETFARAAAFLQLAAAGGASLTAGREGLAGRRGR